MSKTSSFHKNPTTNSKLSVGTGAQEVLSDADFAEIVHIVRDSLPYESFLALVCQHQSILESAAGFCEGCATSHLQSLIRSGVL